MEAIDDETAVSFVDEENTIGVGSGPAGPAMA